MTFEAEVGWLLGFGVHFDLFQLTFRGEICLGDYIGRFLGGNIPEVSGKT